MSARATGGEGRRGGGRAGHLLRAVVLGLAVSAVAGLSLVLLSLWPARWDVTATRSHALSPRTRAVLDGLRGPVRVVIAANVSGADRAASERLGDVLGAFARRSERVQVEVIDTASAGGVEAFDRLLAGLAEEERASIDRARGVLAEAAGECRAIAEGLEGAIEVVGRIGARQAEAVGGLTTTEGQRVRRSFGEQQAALRVMQSGLRRAAEEWEASVAGGLGAGGLGAGAAAVPAARRALAGQLGEATRELERLAQGAESIRGSVSGDGALSAGVREAAGELAGLVAPLRDRAARRGLELGAIPSLRTVLVQEAVTQTQAALVIGPAPAGDGAGADPGIRAIPIDELLPARGVAVGDRRYRAEELLTAALSDLDERARPLMALVHAFTPQGEGFGFFGLAERSLRLRGVEVVEWSVLGGVREPAAVAEARAAGRPVVHTIVGFDPGLSGPGQAADGPLRAVALGDLVRVAASVLEAGGSALVLVPASSLEARGAPDPLAQALRRYGLEIDSGRVLLSQAGAGQLRAVQVETRVLDPMSDHPVARAIDGLPLRLVGPVTMRLVAAEESLGRVRTGAVVRVPAREGTWLEGEWPAAGYEPGGVRDVGPGGEAWVVMASAERQGAGLPGGSQRVLAIGSNQWMLDSALGQSEIVDGRTVQRTAGNAELWAASVLWLAGRDEQVVRGAAAEAVAIGVVPAMEPGRLVGLKWAVVLTPPVVVLLLGGVYGALRR